MFKLLFCYSFFCLLSSCVVSLQGVKNAPHGLQLSHTALEYSASVESRYRKMLDIRGGEDNGKKTGIIHDIQRELVKLLKGIVPRSWWPSSWKSKNSGMMSKEHLEKSFAKGDSSSRVQKVRNCK